MSRPHYPGSLPSFGSSSDNRLTLVPFGPVHVVGTHPIPQVPLLDHLGNSGQFPPMGRFPNSLPHVAWNLLADGCPGEQPEPIATLFGPLYSLPTGLWCSIAIALGHQTPWSDGNLPQYLMSPGCPLPSDLASPLVWQSSSRSKSFATSTWDEKQHTCSSLLWSFAFLWFQLQLLFLHFYLYSFE